MKVDEVSLSGLPLVEEDFRGLIFSVEDKELKPRFPELRQKRVLEVSPKQKSFSAALKEKGAKLVARVGGAKEVTGAKEKETHGGGGEMQVMSHWESLPFLDGSSDVVLLRTSLIKGSLGRLLREASRVLSPKGTVLLSDLHPFSSMVQKEHLKNAVGEEGLGPGFERYTKWFRDAGLKMDWVKEIFFEGGFKKFLSDEEQRQHFDQLRRTPFMIFFSLKKE